MQNYWLGQADSHLSWPQLFLLPRVISIKKPRWRYIRQISFFYPSGTFTRFKRFVPILKNLFSYLCCKSLNPCRLKNKMVFLHQVLDENWTHIFFFIQIIFKYEDSLYKSRITKRIKKFWEFKLYSADPSTKLHSFKFKKKSWEMSLFWNPETAKERTSIVCWKMFWQQHKKITRPRKYSFIIYLQFKIAPISQRIVLMPPMIE